MKNMSVKSESDPTARAASREVVGPAKHEIGRLFDQFRKHLQETLLPSGVNNADAPAAEKDTT